MDGFHNTNSHNSLFTNEASRPQTMSDFNPEGQEIPSNHIPPSPPSQPAISLSQSCRLICEASFDPVLVCSETKIWGCNSRLLEIFGYSSETQFLHLTPSQALDRHFYPKIVIDDGRTRPAGIKDVCKAYVGPQESTKLSSVRAKQWNLDDGQPFFTLSIWDSCQSGPTSPASNTREFTQHKLYPVIHTESTPNFCILQPPVSPFGNPKANLSAPNKTPPSDLVVPGLSQVFDALPCLVWFIGPSGELIYMNKLYKEVLGIEHLLENFADSIHPEDFQKMLPRWKNSLESQTSFSMEIRLRHHPDKPLPPGRDREYRWFSLSSVPINYPNDPALIRWVCSAQDFNDLKVAQSDRQRLEAAEKAAIDASRLKSDFLAMMSHEIRTPLFGVVGNTCLMKETALDSEQKELVDSIELSGKLLMTVIQDVLDFSRIESGRLVIQRSSFKLETLTKNIGQMLKMEATKKGIEFKVTHSNFEGNLVGDSGRLLQVLTNLTSNAIKFTQYGGVHLSAQLHINGDSKQVTLAVRVSDTGIGISAESIPTLFTPWTQADISKRRYYGGSGLGLSICKSLVTLMSGKIGLESKLGEGTTAWFWVPMELEYESRALDLPSTTLTFSSATREPCTASTSLSTTTLPSFPIPVHATPLPTISSPRKAKRRATCSSGSSINRYRVLVAEDNPVNQAILGKFLDKMGDVDYAMLSDGQQALDAYLAQGPGFYDIILLDQSLPGMNGDEVCRRIRNLDGDQILISVSANAMMADQVRFLELGMNDHLSKPVTYDRFTQVLATWLTRGFAQRKTNLPP